LFPVPFVKYTLKLLAVLPFLIISGHGIAPYAPSELNVPPVPEEL